MFRPAVKTILQTTPVSLTHRELQPQHQELAPTTLTLAHFEKSALEFAPGVTDIVYQHCDNNLFLLVPTPMPATAVTAPVAQPWCAVGVDLLHSEPINAVDEEF